MGVCRLDGFELAVVYITVEARFATRGHLSAASRATGPLISVPFISPSGVIRTPALSSKESLVPSGLRSARTCLTTTAGKTCFLRSGLPLDTDTIIISPTQAAGTRRSRPWYPRTFMSFNSFAPVLSAHVSRVPTGRPRAILGLYSTIPRALTALVLGAGTSILLLLSIYHNERDFFAERSAFCYCYSVACCCSNAGRVMGQRLASPPFVSAVFWIIVQVSALN